MKPRGGVRGLPDNTRLLYLLFSLGRFVRFAFPFALRFVSTLQGIQGELFPLYRQHRGWCPWTTSQHRCSCLSTARANWFHSTGSLGGGVRGLPANTEAPVPSFLSWAFRSFRVYFAFRFVSTLQGCFFSGRTAPSSFTKVSKATFSPRLDRQCVRFACLSRFVSSRLYDASLRQSFSLGGQLRLLVLGPIESGRRFFLSPTLLSRTL